MLKKSISLVLSLIMLMAMCVFAPQSFADDWVNFTQNFNSIGLTAYTPEQYTSLTGFTTTKGGGAGLWIAEDSTGDHVARLDHAGGEAKTSLTYEMPTALAKDVLEVSLKMKIEALNTSTSIIHLLNFKSGENGAATVSVEQSTPKFFNVAPSTDDDEYYNLRAVVFRTATTEDWEVKIYDDALATPAVVYTATLAADNFPSIDKICIASTYTTAKGTTYRLDDINIKTYEYVETPVEIDFSQSFDSIWPASYDDANYTSLTGIVSQRETGGGLWIDGSTNSGANRRAKFTHANTGGVVKLFYPIDGKVKKGGLSVGYKLSATEVTGAGNLNMFAFYCGDNAATTLVYWAGTGYGALRVDGNSTNLSPVAVDNMYSLRADVFRETEDQDWTLKVYDDNAAVTSVLYETTLSKDTFPYIDNIRLVQTYAMQKDEYYVIDDVFVRTYEYVEPVAEVDFSQSFDSIWPDAYTAENYTSLTGLLANKNGNGGLWVDGPAESGANRRAKFTHANVGGSVKLFYPIDGKVKKGGLSIGYKLSATEVAGTGKLAMFAFYSGDNKQPTTSYWAGNNSGSFRIGDEQGSLLTAPAVDTNNMYSLKADIYRASENDDWSLKVYDENAKVPTVFYEDTLSKDTFPYIDKVRFVDTYAMQANEYYVIDDVFVKTFDSYDGTISQNFDELADSIDTDAELNAATGIICSNSGTAVAIAKDGYNQMLKLSHTAQGQKANLKYAIPVMTKGTVSLSMKVGQDGTSGDQGVWRIGAIYNGATETILIDRHGAAGFKKYNVNTSSYGFRMNDETNMYHVRVVVSRNDENSNWIYQIWDDGGKSHEGPIMIDSGELAKEDYAKIDAIGIVGSYAMGNTNILVDDVDIDWYKGITLNSVQFASSGAIFKYMTPGLTDITAYLRLHSSDANIEKVTVVMGVYNGEGRLIGIGVLPIDQIGPEANSNPITVSATGFTTDSDSYAQLFFMEDLTSIRPLRATGGLFANGFCE